MLIRPCSTLIAELFNEGDPGLYQPRTWVDLALLLAANFTQFSNITATSGSPPQRRLRTRADSPPFSNVGNPVNAPLRYKSSEYPAATVWLSFFCSLFAISCLDSIDQDDVTTKDVFDELLRVSQEESPTCMFFLSLNSSVGNSDHLHQLVKSCLMM